MSVIMIMLSRLSMNGLRLMLNVPLVNCSLVMYFRNLVWMNMDTISMSSKIRMWNLYNAMWKNWKWFFLSSQQISSTYGMCMIMRLNMTSIALWQRCQQHNTCDQRDLFETKIRNNMRSFWPAIYPQTYNELSHFEVVVNIFRILSNLTWMNVILLALITFCVFLTISSLYIATSGIRKMLFMKSDSYRKRKLSLEDSK